MKLRVMAIVLSALTICFSSNLAAEENQTPDKLWSGNVSLTFISNNGNTKSQNIGFNTRLVREKGLWRNTFKLESLNENTGDARTAEKYFISLKADRKLSELDYIFGLIEHEDDDFSGYEYQTSLSAGYGRKLINSDMVKLEIEVGPGYRRSLLDVDGSMEREGTLRGAINFDWTINETSSFREEVSVEAGEESTISKSISKYRTQLNGRLSLTVSYEIKHTSNVPSGTNKSDSTTLIALDYSF